MEKTIDQSVQERRAYVEQVRESFQKQEQMAYQRRGTQVSQWPEDFERENQPQASTFGLRTVIAILIFAAFVYCDKKQITWQTYDTQDVFSQIEWEAVPMDKILK